MLKILTEKNIYDTWLKSFGSESCESNMRKIDNKLDRYKRHLDENLMKLRNQKKDDLAEVLLADEKSKQIYYMSLLGAGSSSLKKNSLPEGKKLGQDDAKRMLDLGMGKILALRLKYFQGLNKEIAKSLMQVNGNFDYYSYRADCLRNIESFVESDRADIGEMALDCGDTQAFKFINAHLDKYPGIDVRSLAKEYLAYECDDILNNFEGYKGCITLDDFAEIPQDVFYESHCLDFVFNNLDDLGGDRDSFLNLINKVYGESVCDNVKKLFGIKS